MVFGWDVIHFRKKSHLLIPAITEPCFLSLPLWKSVCVSQVEHSYRCTNIQMPKRCFPLSSKSLIPGSLSLSHFGSLLSCTINSELWKTNMEPSSPQYSRISEFRNVMLLLQQKANSNMTIEYFLSCDFVFLCPTQLCECCSAAPASESLAYVFQGHSIIKDSPIVKQRLRLFNSGPTVQPTQTQTRWERNS